MEIVAKIGLEISLQKIVLDQSVEASTLRREESELWRLAGSLLIKYLRIMTRKIPSHKRKSYSTL